jgi:hypothetical protein
MVMLVERGMVSSDNSDTIRPKEHKIPPIRPNTHTNPQTNPLDQINPPHVPPENPPGLALGLDDDDNSVAFHSSSEDTRDDDKNEDETEDKDDDKNLQDDTTIDNTIGTNIDIDVDDSVDNNIDKNVGHNNVDDTFNNNIDNNNANNNNGDILGHQDNGNVDSQPNPFGDPSSTTGTPSYTTPNEDESPILNIPPNVDPFHNTPTIPPSSPLSPSGEVESDPVSDSLSPSENITPSPSSAYPLPDEMEPDPFDDSLSPSEEASLLEPTPSPISNLVNPTDPTTPTPSPTDDSHLSPSDDTSLLEPTLSPISNLMDPTTPTSPPLAASQEPSPSDTNTYTDMDDSVDEEGHEHHDTDEDDVLPPSSILVDPNVMPSPPTSSLSTPSPPSSESSPTPSATPLDSVQAEKLKQKEKENAEKDLLERKVRQEYDDEMTGMKPGPTLARNSTSLLLPRPLLFVHVPKTAGSTLAQVFKNNVPKDKYYHFWSHPRVNELPKVNDKEVIFGHFRYGLHFYLPNQTATYATMLRDPVERVVSYYHFHLQDTKDPAHKFAMEHTFEEWLELSPAAQNEMTKCLSGIRSEFYPSNHSFEMAKHHLKSMGYVGLTERFEESLKLMKFYFGFDKFSYDTTKVGVKKPQTIDPAVRQKIIERNKMDMELYEMAKGIFEKQLEELSKLLLRQVMTTL